jgi:DNA-binding transcriptional LysR family regulator
MLASFNADMEPNRALQHRHIEVFRAVMTAGSVTGAAALLFTSQPTVSRELSRLAQLLGFTLFDRVKGRLQPTQQALALFDEVQRSYVGLERIAGMAASLRQFTHGQLSVVCQPAFAHFLLPGACKAFLAAHPGVSVSITTQESPLLEEWLSAQRHDLGLTEHDVPPPGTQLTPLMQADEVCVLPAGHALAHKRKLRPVDFQGLPFVSLSPSDPYRLQVDAVFRQAGVERRQVVETHSAASVCAMVQQGLGLAIVNPLTALDFVDRGVVVRPFSVSIPFRVSLVRPVHRPRSPLVDVFAKALESETRRLLARRPAAPGG